MQRLALARNVLSRHLTVRSSRAPAHAHPAELQRRHVSLTGAIERGIRKGRKDPPSTKPLDQHQQQHQLQAQRQRAEWSIHRRRGPKEPGDDDGHLSAASVAPFSRSSFTFGRNARSFRSLDSQKPADRTAGTSRADLDSIVPPRAIPYTTAASEFLYGTFAVEAAVRAQRRKLYKLYIYCPEDGEEAAAAEHERLRKFALAAGVKVIKVGGDGWRSMLGRMTEARPHNGVVLEASRIPQLPVVALQRHRVPEDPLRAVVGHQSLDVQDLNNVFEISGSTATIPAARTKGRYPFLILLDRITDSGNVGAILRSAYYFGADGVTFLDHGTAPFTAVTLKASAGAAEYLPIFRIKDELKFIRDSQENGWKFFAAVAPDSASRIDRRVKHKDVSLEISQAVETNPCVLMLGNEADGIRPKLEKMADGRASIDGAAGRHQGIDSLNVSVAAALLMRDFLRPSPLSQSH